MAPIIIGLVFAAPIAVATSSVAAGQFARRLGVFVTPEELYAPMAVEPVADVAPGCGYADLRLIVHFAEVAGDERPAIAGALEEIEGGRFATVA
ncbi:MAG: hypothetical protein IPL62_13125 [Caulobacteraceae bacterium]|nr:hypothetical protein [Caulobacteraceae bacterium]